MVTGATGFIGRHLVSALRSAGVRTRVLIRHAEAAPSFVDQGAEVVIGDLRDDAVVRQASTDVEFVFHLAGRLFRPGVPVREYERLHVESTAALMKACSELAPGSGFLLCSTTGVHGPTGSRLPGEDDAPAPSNAYESTKAAGERVATEIATRASMPLVIARPGLVYGPGDLHLLGLFRAIRGGYYRVIGSGDNRLHPIFVDDVVEGLVRCAKAASASVRAYHLVGSRAVTMRELSDAIGAAVGHRVPRMHVPRAVALVAGAVFEALPVPRRWLPLTRSRVRFMTQDRAYDGTRAARELAFSPGVELADGLGRTVGWYKERGFL